MSVPKCKECECMTLYTIVYKYLYCNALGKQICAGDKIKTSPIWCPRRKAV